MDPFTPFLLGSGLGVALTQPALAALAAIQAIHPPFDPESGSRTEDRRIPQWAKDIQPRV
jgi:hypothetical protein